MEICGTDAEWKREMLSLDHPVDHRIGSGGIHAPAATRGEKKCKVKKQRRSTKHPRTKIQGEKHLRGEWDTVVDGHQAVEHERCVFRTMSESLTVVINDFAVRTYELAESIDIGVLVGGRYTNPA